MELTFQQASGRFQLQAYSPGQIRINDTLYQKSVILSENQLISDWRPQSFREMKEADLDVLIALKPDILLIGTGSSQHFLPPPYLEKVISSGIRVEVMKTESACLTFIALLSEGRHVVAALLLD